VILVRIDFSREHIAFTLKMEAMCTSEMSVLAGTTWRYVPEDCVLCLYPSFAVAMKCEEPIQEDDDNMAACHEQDLPHLYLCMCIHLLYGYHECR
jgi:hypothetical protein